MNELTISSGITLSYQEEEQIILVNGKPNSKWQPVYLSAGNDEPDFYGYYSLENNLIYDILDEVIEVTNQAEIRIDGN